MEEEYDFTQHYKKGDVIYHVRCFEKVDVKEVNKLKIGNGIYQTYMIGYKENKEAVVLGKDHVRNNLIFSNLKEANTRLKELSKNMKTTNKTEIPNQIIDAEEEQEKLDSCIDGDDENE
jgi:hypothetical protein